MEYIITVKDDKYGWCLHLLCGTDEKRALQLLIQECERHPDKEFRVEAVEEKDCWWNDPFLCN